MQVDTRILEQIQIDLETARGVIASGQLSAEVDEATKLLAAAITAAGAEIAPPSRQPRASDRDPL
jgi:hypothetical protein